MASRLLEVPAAHRVLLAFGDGRPLDEAYEGAYAVADSAKALEEAGDAGLKCCYLATGPAERDPLGEVLGPRHFTRVENSEHLVSALRALSEEMRD